MKISLCMIVKNEEDHLAECLNSVAGYVDEIIIVDTGSQDNTVKIAEGFTDKIFNFQWVDDFSKARNYSLSKASNDWILVLDADEVVINFDKDDIFNFTKSNELSTGRINIINLIEDIYGLQKQSERISRLFNRNFYHYSGQIHEQLIPLDTNSSIASNSVEIEVNHIGYRADVIGRKDKANRNLSILMKELLNNPDDPYIHYHLGKTYTMAKDYTNACNFFNSALQFPLNFNYEYVFKLVESYGYALLNSNRYGEALQIEKYSVYYNAIPEYNFLMGLIYMNNAKFSMAVDRFSKCINAKDSRLEGINSYLPNYNIGVIYECLGYNTEAFYYYQQCNNYKPALDRIKGINKQ